MARKRCTKSRARKGLCTKKSGRGRRGGHCGRTSKGRFKKC